jgi:hypothetical protein
MPIQPQTPAEDNEHRAGGRGMKPLALLAAALGVEPGTGCECAFCGPSAFSSAGDLRSISDAVVALQRHPGADQICGGCKRLLAGKPGDDPPPLRLRSLLWVEGGGLSYPTRDELRAVIAAPPPGPHVVSHAVSRKKHHVLHAGLSDARLQRWGTDDRMVHVYPEEHDRVLQDIETMLAWHSRTEVDLASYSAPRISAQGRDWFDVEDRLRQYRGTQVWTLILIPLARKPERGTAPPAQAKSLDPFDLFAEYDMIDRIDALASGMLADIAGASGYRAERGLDFWRGFFARRLERHAHRPLAELASRLMADCQCSTTSPDVARVIEALSTITDDDAAAVLVALRTRPALLISMAYSERRSPR